MSKIRLAQLQQRLNAMGIGIIPQDVANKAINQVGVPSVPTTGQGMIATPENAIKYLQRLMQVDYEQRAMILDLRTMDRADPRIKKIHNRMARTSIKGGLLIKTKSSNKKLIRHWDNFSRRLKLHRREKLESDSRGLVMEGNLPMQWLIGEDNRVHKAIRMPTETIVPRVTEAGIFEDTTRAYDQHNLFENRVIASFALWQLSMVRLTPDNFDDEGSLGRPYLDATRSVWKKLVMSEEDLVIRRKTRAAARRVHTLKGASDEEFKEYKAERERDTYDVTTDYVIKGDGDVKPVQGDASLHEIADVVHLLDTFFSGAPANKAIFGYAGNLSRDVLEDLQRDFYDEIDSIQDLHSFAYELGFRLDLLLNGVNPDDFDFSIVFKERKTETANQMFDRALKAQALGMSKETQMEIAGRDPAVEKQRVIDESKEEDPYPDQDGDPKPPARAPGVKVTPGNGRKGESATTISTRSN